MITVDEITPYLLTPKKKKMRSRADKICGRNGKNGKLE